MNPDREAIARAPRAILSVDGEYGCALVGENLQEGEAEFVKVEPRDGEYICNAEIRACTQAYRKLQARLPYQISYAWHPRKPGASGA